MATYIHQDWTPKLSTIPWRNFVMLRL